MVANAHGSAIDDGRIFRSRVRSSPCRPPVTRCPETRSRSSVKRLLHSRASSGAAGSHTLLNSLPRSHATQRRMSAQHRADLARVEALRFEQLSRVEVAAAVRCDQTGLVDGAEPGPADVRIERPAGQPVDPAHVTAEEGRHRAQTAARDQLHETFEPAEHRALHPSRFGLEVGPTQEEADGIEAEVGDAREVVRDLAGVEALPHVHRAAARPVVDPERESHRPAGFAIEGATSGEPKGRTDGDGVGRDHHGLEVRPRDDAFGRDHLAGARGPLRDAGRLGAPHARLDVPLRRRRGGARAFA